LEINAVILAAGLSSRMKAFKPLMKLKDKTMIEHSIDCMLRAGVNQTVVVLGYRANEVEELLFRNYDSDRVISVHNRSYMETDMLTSVKIGISALRDCDAFYLLPGDMPAISTSTLLAVKDAMNRTDAMVVFPEVNEHRKHPPLILWKWKDLILKYNGDGGLRELWKQFEDRIITVPVDDPGCLMDADTMEDYEKLKHYMEEERINCINYIEN
jgi:CTP:molybdopterin cytidylyltransferase MocA